MSPPGMPDAEVLLGFMIATAVRAGRAVAAGLNGTGVCFKADNSPVTAADERSEAVIREASEPSANPEHSGLSSV